MHIDPNRKAIFYLKILVAVSYRTSLNIFNVLGVPVNWFTFIFLKVFYFWIFFLTGKLLMESFIFILKDTISAFSLALFSTRKCLSYWLLFLFSDVFFLWPLSRFLLEHWFKAIWRCYPWYSLFLMFLLLEFW